MQSGTPYFISPSKLGLRAPTVLAWPKTIGLSLGMQISPRLQSFAWNPGKRSEPNVMPQTSIRDIISLEEMKMFAEVYLREVHPFFGILDQDMFEKRFVDFWFSQQQGTDFEACVCKDNQVPSILYPHILRYCPLLSYSNEVSFLQFPLKIPRDRKMLTLRSRWGGCFRMYV